MHAYIHTYTYIHTQFDFSQGSINIHAYIHAYIHIHTSMHTYIHIHAYRRNVTSAKAALAEIRGVVNDARGGLVGIIICVCICACIQMYVCMHVYNVCVVNDARGGLVGSIICMYACMYTVVCMHVG
jgi:hypothetical protein